MLADSLYENVCVSGGADGSDLHWGACAAAVGHRVVHLGFATHRSSAPPETYVVLSRARLLVADPFLDRAATYLQRDWREGSGYTKNLLRRNYYQQYRAGSIYGIVPRLDTQRRPVGGTAWALHMFVDRWRGQPCAAYVYVQNLGSWLTWDGQRWVAIPTEAVPRPTGIWAGVGCRPEKLTRAGMDAASALLGLPQTASGQLNLEI